MNRPAAPILPTSRPMCMRCRRPQVVCYCAALPTLETRTKIVILQHPREREVAIGTARMAALCLPQAELHVGIDWSNNAALARALSDPERPAIMLYPGADARDILREPPAGPVTLVVVDGTWSQAKNVVRDNPVLQALPRYAFAAPEPSQYRIRKEPSDDVVSTIEAIMYVLGALEGDRDKFRALLAPFHAMVDAQIAAQAAQHSPRPYFKRPTRPLRSRLPAPLVDRPDDVVCVAAESNAWPYRDAPDHAPEELVHWIAYRPATGEQFEAIAAPTGALSPSTPFHAGLDAATLMSGGTRAQLNDGFARFVRPSDIVCAWGHYGPRLFLDGGGRLPGAIVDLRVAAQKMARKKFGSLEDYAASLGPAPAPLGSGRAGERVALLAQIVAAWRAAVASDEA